MRKLRERLTFANVISVVALFVALGGTALAASQLGKNTVGTKQLKKNAVTGEKVKDNSLTGRDVNESTLGQVPSAASAGRATSAGNADTLGGIPPNGFAQSSRLIDGSASTSVKSPQTVLTVPGEFRILTTGDGKAFFFPEWEGISPHPWRFIYPDTSYLTVYQGKKDGFNIPSYGTALIFAQDTLDTSKYVLIQCGIDPPEQVLACQASLSPAA